MPFRLRTIDTLWIRQGPVDGDYLGGCVLVTPAGKSSRVLSRRSHSAFSSPRMRLQSGRLALEPRPRETGGTASVVGVASAVRVRVVVSVELMSEEVGCVPLALLGSVAVVDPGVDDCVGCAGDGLVVCSVAGVGVEGGGEFCGWRTGVCVPGDCGVVAGVALEAGVPDDALGVEAD